MRQEIYENKMSKTIALVYVGEGIKISGIPAKDLTPEEVENLGGIEKLRQTGLYITPLEAQLDGGNKWQTA